MDATGAIMTTLYDARTRVVGQMDALGFISTTVYDNAGRVWASVNPLNQRTTTVYDRSGRVWAMQDALGFLTTSTYDGRGNRIAVQNSRGYRTTSLYDARRQQIGQVDALGYRKTTVYDPLGRVRNSTDAFGNATTSIYDAVGQLIARQDALGNMTTTVYDLDGRSVATIDPLGNISTSVFDPLGRVVAGINARGYATTSVYDPMGNRTAEINPLGFATTHSYDLLNRRVARMDPLGRVMTSVYDAVGRTQVEISALGQRTTHLYNLRGEETARFYADGQWVTSVYDPAGRIVTVMDALGRTYNTYDALGRLLTTLGPGHPTNQPLTYAYDPNGNRSTLTGWWGVFSYTYDARDSLRTLADPGDPTRGVAAGITTFSYDGRGQRTREDYSNGTYATYLYDPVGRTVQIRQATVAGADIERSYYSYDPLGRPLSKLTLNTAHTYAYDAIGQLIGESVTQPPVGGMVTNTAWTYDPANRRSLQVKQGTAGTFGITYAYNAADEMLSASAVGGITTYGYDRNGSRITQVTNNQRTTFQWDGANRMSQVSLPTGTVVYEQYRADGLRYRQTTSAANGNGRDSLTLWDGDTPLTVEDAALALASATNFAQYLGTDSTTKGSWRGTTTPVYGSQGYWFCGTTSTTPYNTLPAYASLSFTGASYFVWSTSTTDVRALQKPSPATDRVAATEYSATSFTLDLNLTDGQVHQVALYCLDWENAGRAQRIDVVDATTGALLATRTISSFNNGLWIRFAVRGHVRFVNTRTASNNAVVLGVYLDPYTSNVPNQQFIAEPNSGRLLRSVGATGQGTAVARQFHTDAQGTVETVSRGSGSGSGAVGTVEGDYRLDAWGNPLPGSATAATVPDNPFAYLGGLGYWQEPDLGLSYVRARWLDSTTGTWLSVDPVEGEPRYCYVFNAPSYGLDPSGTQPPTDGKFLNNAARLREERYQQWLAEQKKLKSEQTPDQARKDSEDGYLRSIGAMGLEHSSPTVNTSSSEPDSLDYLTDFFAGWGDILSFGATGLVRKWTGLDAFVNANSTSYNVGQWTGVVEGLFEGGVGVFGAAKAAKAAGGIRAIVLEGKNIIKTPGFTLRPPKVPGGYWVKTATSAFGRQALAAQVDALRRLGSMAPKWRFVKGVLFVKDAGKFDGNLLKLLVTYVNASRKIGFANDVRWARNIGTGGKIFDPALPPIQRGVYSGTWATSRVLIRYWEELNRKGSESP